MLRASLEIWVHVNSESRLGRNAAVHVPPASNEPLVPLAAVGANSSSARLQHVPQKMNRDLRSVRLKPTPVRCLT